MRGLVSWWRKPRKLDADVIALILDTQERAVVAALEAVSACVSKTVASVLEATLGPPNAQVDVEDRVLNDLALPMARVAAEIDGLRPAWGDAPLDTEEDPDPTNLDKPFDTYTTWDVPPADDPLWTQPPSTQRAAFLRPGESPIPTEPST